MGNSESTSDAAHPTLPPGVYTMRWADCSAEERGRLQAFIDRAHEGAAPVRLLDASALVVQAIADRRVDGVLRAWWTNGGWAVVDISTRRPDPELVRQLVTDLLREAGSCPVTAAVASADSARLEIFEELGFVQTGSSADDRQRIFRHD